MLLLRRAIIGPERAVPRLTRNIPWRNIRDVYRDHKICVAIPAYRTEATILEVIEGLPTYVDQVIVVDDASPDATWEKLQRCADPRLTALRHQANQGVGGAMRTAFRKSLEIGCDVVVKVDGDGQMEAGRIADLLDAIIDCPCDYAKGNRFLHREALATMPRRRLIGSMALTFLTKMASGYWHIFDPQNGFMACRASVLARLELDHIATDYFFENDMLIHLNILACRVVDVPMPARYGNEVSSLQISRVLLTFPMRLFRGYWRRIYARFVVRDFSPIALFLLAGLPLTLWGVGFGVYGWVESWRSGVVASTGTVMFAALPLILGFQLLLQAILLDIHSTPR